MMSGANSMTEQTTKINKTRRVLTSLRLNADKFIYAKNKELKMKAALIFVMVCILLMITGCTNNVKNFVLCKISEDHKISNEGKIEKLYLVSAKIEDNKLFTIEKNGCELEIPNSYYSLYINGTDPVNYCGIRSWKGSSGAKYSKLYCYNNDKKVISLSLSYPQLPWGEIILENVRDNIINSSTQNISSKIRAKIECMEYEYPSGLDVASLTERRDCDNNTIQWGSYEKGVFIPSLYSKTFS
jgi:hypothetical protein